MTQFFTDFSEYATGSQPADWTRRWVTTDTWTVESVSGNNVLRHSASSTGQSRRAISWDDVGTPSGDVEIVYRWRRTNAAFDVNDSMGIGVLHGGGSAASEDGYVARWSRDGAGAYTTTSGKYVSGTFSAIGSATTPEGNAGPTTNSWYWTRVQRTGTTLRFRTWADGDSEPGTWDSSETDASLSSGWVGVGMFDNNSVVEFDLFGVGTGGDAAPTENEAPTITVAPTVSYGSRTRTGPENTPAVVSFTATDPEESGTDELNWGIYTATAGGGTEVASGTCTSGVQEQVNIAYNASGLSEGSNTLYLLVDDGAGDDEESFTLLRDDTAPVSFTATADPSTVSTRLYAVEMTANDATSTATDELTWQIRTAASGAGSLLAHGTRTSSGTAFTTPQFIDPALEDGSNTRYVRVIDGAGNVREESFTVTGDDLPVPVVADTPYSRARPQAIDLITIAIYRPLGQYINGTRAPLDTLDINPSVTAVSWGSVLPGGWSSASVGIAHPNHDDRYGEPPRRPWLPREMAFGAFHHVEIRRHGRVLYAGRMGTQQRAYGRATGFTVQGYGMVATHDMYYRNTSDTVVSSGALLRAVIAATAPHLIAAPDGDLWQDPGVGHAYSEFNRMYLGDVLDQIAAEGDSAANMVDWTVFEDQMVRLQVRREPERADYLVPWSMVPDYVEDTSGLAGAASYERVMAGGGAVTSASDYITPGFIDTYGIQRGHLLTVGQISQTAAIAMTKAYLELHKRPVVSAAIEAGPDVRLESPGGREMPREGVRAGQWVQIEGMDYPLVIVSTDYDAFADVVRIQAGEFMPDFGMLLASIQKDRRKWQRRMNYYAGKSL